ncbi:MAG TPA: YSC84-related protein [Anaeromyxobacteraceae bacterium]|nr:YSC84-related protein [Anaeromyxobacteraceae bacterium]
MPQLRNLAAAAALALVAFLPAAARAEATLKETEQAIAALKKADPGLSGFFEKAAGYAVFPDVGKGGFIVGGAGGSGFLFEGGKAIGKTTMAQATVGAQIGGQTYVEVVFFETREALAAFKKGEWTMAAQVSAVVVKSGASADAKYKDGIAVFTLPKAGAMAEASIGGQKFTFTPNGAKKK